jgi:hypothetical protein
MSWEIIPGQRIGPVRLGMTELEVQSALPITFSRFVRNQYANCETWHFLEMNLQVDFSRSTRKVEYIMACRGADVTMFGQQILGEDRDRWIGKLMKLGYTPTRNDAGCDFLEIGIDFFIESGWKELVAPIEAVGVSIATLRQGQE